MVKSFIKKNYPFLIPFIFLFALHSYFMIFNKSYMIFYGDSFEQNLMFYLGGWERFHSLNFSMWDWTLGYGADIFSRTYYFLTSPFFWLTLIFPKAWIPKLILFLYILKMYLLWVFSYMWLNEINRNKLASFIGAMILTFSGWVLFYYHFSFFLDAFVFYPLILFGIEIYLKKHKILLLVLMTACLAIINYYFMYMFLPFMGLYFWFRYLAEIDFKLKNFILETLKFVGLTILGMGIASFVFIPSITQILSTPRLNGITFSLFDHVALKDLFRFISTFYSPVMERFDPTYFLSTDVYSGIGWGGGVSIHLGYLSLLLVPIYVLSTAKKERNAFLIILGLLLVSSFFVVFYRLYQGTMDARWYYMYVFIFVFAITKAISNLQQIENLKKLVLISFGLNLAILVLLLLVSRISSFNTNEVKNTQLIYIFIYAFCMFSIYSFLIFKRVALNTLLLVVLMESSIAFFIPLIKNPPMEWMIIEDQLDDLFNQSAVDYIKSIDDSFYRILKDSQTYLNQNEPFVQGYNGISYYSSIYNFDTTEYYNRFNKTYSIPNTLGRDNSYLLTSVKYFITSTNSHTQPIGFEYLKSIDGSDIYINKYFIPLGLIQTKTLNQETFDQLSYLNQDRLLLDYAITSDSMNTSYEFRNTLLIFGNEVHIDRYYFYLPDTFKNTMVYIQNNESSNVELRSSINTEFFRNDNYSQNFYLTKYFDANSQVDGLEINIPNADQLAKGYNIYLDTDLDWYDQWYQEKSNGFKNIVFTNSSITASITINNDSSYVVTSIPFNENWIVKVNGNKVEYDALDSGFIGLVLDKGEYSLEFIYQNRLMKYGILLSISCLLVIICLYKCNKTK